MGETPAFGNYSNGCDMVKLEERWVNSNNKCVGVGRVRCVAPNIVDSICN